MAARSEAHTGAGGNGVGRTRVLVVQPYIRPAGGDNAVTACMLQALQDDHDVTVLTWEPVDLARINAYYGTRLDGAKLRCRLAPALLRRLTSRDRLNLLKHNVLLRQCKAMCGEYDVVLGANSESDFGCRGVQYIHYPRFDDPRLRTAVGGVMDPNDLRWFHRCAPLIRLYFRLCGAVSGFSLARVRRNVTLVNSDWTAARVREVHGVVARTVYPPVAGDFPKIPWAAREHGFVCVGRIAPAKRIERIIAILEQVRQRGHAVHLHVVGSVENARYLAELRERARVTALPVSFDTDVSHVELRRLLAQHKYGLHAMEREHFGIAVAEMAKAGCVVFVPDSGGQVEVVGHDAHLTYRSDADAARKIEAVLADEALQEHLRAHLATCGARFGSERFIGEIRALVAGLAR